MLRHLLFPLCNFGAICCFCLSYHKIRGKVPTFKNCEVNISFFTVSPMQQFWVLWARYVHRGVSRLPFISDTNGLWGQALQTLQKPSKKFCYDKRILLQVISGQPIRARPLWLAYGASWAATLRGNSPHFLDTSFLVRLWFFCLQEGFVIWDCPVLPNFDGQRPFQQIPRVLRQSYGRCVWPAVLRHHSRVSGSWAAKSRNLAHRLSLSFLSELLVRTRMCLTRPNYLGKLWQVREKNTKRVP